MSKSTEPTIILEGGKSPIDKRQRAGRGSRITTKTPLIPAGHPPRGDRWYVVTVLMTATIGATIAGIVAYLVLT